MQKNKFTIKVNLIFSLILLIVAVQFFGLVAPAHAANTKSITATQTISDTNYDDSDLTISGSGTVVTISGVHNFNSLTIKDNAVLTHAAIVASDLDASGNLNSGVSDVKKVDLTIKGDLVLTNGGKIDVSGKGYPGGLVGKNGYGSVAGLGLNTTIQSAAASGGSNAGKGGNNSGSNTSIGDYGSGGGGADTKYTFFQAGAVVYGYPQISDHFDNGSYTQTIYHYNKVPDYCTAWSCNVQDYNWSTNKYTWRSANSERECEQVCPYLITYKEVSSYTSTSTGSGNCPPSPTYDYFGMKTSECTQNVYPHMVMKDDYSNPYWRSQGTVSDMIEASATGGSGGGKVSLKITGKIAIDDTSAILANGSDGSYGVKSDTPIIGTDSHFPNRTVTGTIGYAYAYGGAGAGGSIKISASDNQSTDKTVSATGGIVNGTGAAITNGFDHGANIQANGGNGGNSLGGGGGGGFVNLVKIAQLPTSTGELTKRTVKVIVSWQENGKTVTQD